MNRRQFFQSVVAVAVVPEVKPPMMGFSKLYRGGRYEAYDIETSRLIKEMCNANYGKILYADTDGVFVRG